KSLRDASADNLAAARARLEPLEYKRAYHVVTEIARTLEAAAAAERGDWKAFGGLMVESHRSLRDDFEGSTGGVDLVVDLACEIGEAGGVIGSRMTGGGFGGCTVSLVKTDAVAGVSRRIADAYKAKTGTEATIFATRPAAGARRLEP